MHIRKISAIIAQVSLTSASVLAGHDMGKRDSWEDAKAFALPKASETAAKFNAAPEAMITPSPVVSKRQFFGGIRPDAGFEIGRQQGLAAAQAAQERVDRITNDFNSRFPPLFPGFRNNGYNNKRGDDMDQGQQYNDDPDRWDDNNGVYHSYYSGAAAGYASAANDGAYKDANQAQQGWQRGAPDWQAHASSWAGYGDYVAASAHGLASEAVASANGVAATAAAGYGDGDWEGDVASAHGVASGYQSEYYQGGVASPSGVQPTASASHGTQMVQVNEGAAGVSGGRAVGLVVGVAGVVFGML
ncbi:hypothetical protein QC764_111180 [Podospora pseudoanserina]|uniref:Uncharacterized protein n=1 Tax=Podospora pseudoanserina TaxID=2609844 RepID=A0ABR0INE1_9PEZI|nr:hypothetical protein QC764_111180 [Podospora pseudoanserina]